MLTSQTCSSTIKGWCSPVFQGSGILLLFNRSYLTLWKPSNVSFKPFQYLIAKSQHRLRKKPHAVVMIKARSTLKVTIYPVCMREREREREERKEGDRMGEPYKAFSYHLALSSSPSCSFCAHLQTVASFDLGHCHIRYIIELPLH